MLNLSVSVPVQHDFLTFERSTDKMVFGYLLDVSLPIWHLII